MHWNQYITHAMSLGRRPIQRAKQKLRVVFKFEDGDEDPLPELPSVKTWMGELFPITNLDNLRNSFGIDINNNEPEEHWDEYVFDNIYFDEGEELY